MENWVPYIVLVVVALTFLSGFKIAKEHERFAVFIMGRFFKLKGPGLVLRIPGQSSEFVRIAIGNRGELVGDGFAKFDDKTIPVKLAGIVPIGTPVQIRSFSESEILVYPDTSRGKKVVCEKCGHEMHI